MCLRIVYQFLAPQLHQHQNYGPFKKSSQGPSSCLLLIDSQKMAKNLLNIFFWKPHNFFVGVFQWLKVGIQS